MSDSPSSTNGLGEWSLRARYNLGVALSSLPALYIPLVRIYCVLGRRWARPPGRSTEIVIEGFPRSANSFAARAFELAQGRAVRMAHHVHTAGSVIPALRRGAPVLILVRRPEEAVLSYHAIWPRITLRQLLRDYVRFYSRLAPYADRFVVAEFEQVTRDFGEVIRRVNEKFATAFREFVHTEENVERSFAGASAHGRRDARKGTLAGPSRQRSQNKDQLRAQLDGPELRDLRAEANRLYERYAALAGPDA